jgi:hypothetical protein
MGWINKNVWLDESGDGHLKFLRSRRRKTKIKRLFGWI